MKTSKKTKNADRVTKVKDTKPKAKAPTPKYTPVKSGDKVRINEAVGIHFSADLETAPKAGDMVCLHLDGLEIPLLVRYTKPKVDGSMFVQAFICQKGMGHHEVMGKHKDQLAIVTWE